MSVEIGVGGLPVARGAGVWVNEDIKEWYASVRTRMLDGVIQVRRQGIKVFKEFLSMVAINEATKTIINKMIIVFSLYGAIGNGKLFNVCDSYLCKGNC